jgi:hypothetical protein
MPKENVEKERQCLKSFRISVKVNKINPNSQEYEMI